MKKSNIFRKFTAGVTAFAASAACMTSSMFTTTEVLTANAAPDSDNYAKLLQYSMYLYDGNLCGDEVGEKSGFSWRDDCHTGDAVPGGYHDCGDHVKFGITAGYSAATLGWSYYEYRDVFDTLGQTGHLKMITDHFAKYFRDCTTLSGGSVSEFIYQIGDGNADHNSYWGPPEEQDQSSRKVFRTSSGASDIAAEYAAALAVNYLNFGNEEDLTYAKALYEFSTKYNKCATDGVGGFYDSNTYLDDQAFAAGFLYLATKEDKYNSFLKSNQKDPNWEFCWNNVYLGASVLNGEINGDWSIVSKYAQSKLTNASQWYCPDSWGAARYNTAAQFMGLLLTKYGKGSYGDWAKSQMGMILGENPKNVCLVVGYSDISAKYPHHEAASGLRGWDEYNRAGATFGGKGHTLTGALEGGFSNTSFSYTDALNDITSSEVGIDYNATLVAAAAGLYSLYETGSIDATVNGVDRNVQYEEIIPGETRTTTTQDPRYTTTTTTVVTSLKYEDVPGVSGKTEIDIKLNGATGIQIEISADQGDIFNGAFSYNDTSGQYGQFGNIPNTTMDSSGVYTLTESTKYIDAQNDTVTFHIWWSQNGSAKIKSVKLIYSEVVSNTTTASTTTVTPNTTVPTTTAEQHVPYMVKVNIVDEDGKQIPGVEYELSGVSLSGGGAYFGEKQFTSGSTADEIDVNWNDSDLNNTGWSLNITSVPTGYIKPKTQPNGKFSFVDSTTAEVTVTIEKDKTATDRLWGDANLDSKVTVADAVAILQSLGNKDKYKLSSEGALNADVYDNGDGVTATDALTIQQMDAGLYKQTDFPVSYKK